MKAFMDSKATVSTGPGISNRWAAKEQLNIPYSLQFFLDMYEFTTVIHVFGSVPTTLVQVVTYWQIANFIWYKGGFCLLMHI